tara:strand:- start:133 stop:651 length:519 start_codon:yes stop_codon:yes gene_type:complete
MTGSTIYPTALRATPHDGAKIIPMSQDLSAILGQADEASLEEEVHPVDLRQDIIDTIKALENSKPGHGYQVAVTSSDCELLVHPFFTKQEERMLEGKNFNVSLLKDGQKTSILDFEIAGDHIHAYARHGTANGQRLLKGMFSHASDVPLADMIKDMTDTHITGAIYDMTPVH